jgi:hypothetical protein
MRTLYILLAIIFSIPFIGCNSDRKDKLSTDVVTNPNSASGEQENTLPVMAFEKDMHDFGKLIAGEKAVYTFKFRNAGKSDLVISQVKSSCGCTVPRYPKEPIGPGEEGEIKVTFDSSSRKGMQNKAITIVTNCQPNSTIIRIKAQVISP